MVLLSGHFATVLQEARGLLHVGSPLLNEAVVHDNNTHAHDVLGFGFLEEAHGAHGLTSRTAVSPALRCVTFLTIFFFGTYLAAVCGRVFRLAVGDRSSESARRFEQRLTEVTESMTLAPMLCVLMISARLRALSLDPGSEPEFHVQVCMYVSTVAFLLRVALGLVRPLRCDEAAPVRAVTGEPGGGDHDKQNFTLAVVRCAYCGLSVLLYLTAFCILILGTCAEGDGTGREGDWLSGPPLSPMVRCIAAITATYMLEIALLEALSGVRQHFGASLLVDQQDSPQLQPTRGWQQTPIALEETVSLRIPIMLCVLLVAMELRAVQLKLEPEAWMAIAMYVTTTSIALQALLTGVISTLQSAPQPRKSKDASDGDSGFFQHVTAITWGATLACLYLGTGAILASVIVMEEQPLGLFVGAQAFIHKLHSLGISADEVMRKAPPLSTAMKCVMLLTVVYFIIYLCMILANAVQGTARKWVQAVLRSAQQSLAFVPMLCIMMTAVRLRAMQLRVRDPQPWAQSTMYVATFAVITQAACSLCACSVSSDECDDEGFNDSNPRPENLLGKVAVILLLFLRYVASAVLHVAVAALFVALLIMEPDLVNA